MHLQPAGNGGIVFLWRYWKYTAWKLRTKLLAAVYADVFVEIAPVAVSVESVFPVKQFILLVHILCPVEAKQLGQMPLRQFNFFLESREWGATT